MDACGMRSMPIGDLTSLLPPRSWVVTAAKLIQLGDRDPVPTASIRRQAQKSERRLG